MPFMYPEQLRELRAQYPDTQFDGHGRVIGGTPLNQYNAQPANPAAIPTSVRTYSQFDPATGTWIRHTNSSAPAQSPAPAPVQGTPINFQQVLGYTPAGFEGATLNVGSRANAQPRQVMRPLARGNARQANQPQVVPSDIGLGVTVTPVNNGDPYANHANENPAMPLTQPRAAARTWEQYLNRNVTPSTLGAPTPPPAKTVYLTPDMLSPMTQRRYQMNDNSVGRVLRNIGNGLLGYFINPDPDYTNHSDPRW